MTITCKNEITKDMKGSNESDTSSERLKYFFFFSSRQENEVSRKEIVCDSVIPLSRIGGQMAVKNARLSES